MDAVALVLYSVVSVMATATKRVSIVMVRLRKHAINVKVTVSFIISLLVKNAMEKVVIGYSLMLLIQN